MYRYSLGQCSLTFSPSHRYVQTRGTGPKDRIGLGNILGNTFKPCRFLTRSHRPLFPFSPLVQNLRVFAVCIFCSCKPCTQLLPAVLAVRLSAESPHSAFCKDPGRQPLGLSFLSFCARSVKNMPNLEYLLLIPNLFLLETFCGTYDHPSTKKRHNSLAGDCAL